MPQDYALAYSVPLCSAEALLISELLAFLPKYQKRNSADTSVKWLITAGSFPLVIIDFKISATISLPHFGLVLQNMNKK